ncbi:putative pectate lyase D [Phytophthora citrophthora]|uniref:Probable pectate lyase F n=1 Tax=Phytophthora citrophthora TaxID=4793 RepID=A0AAD9GTX6_9STRA|nr:putative pectate lyase D [Phytophthora citrophthora]
MEMNEISDDITFDSVESPLELGQEGRKLAGTEVNTELWAENYTPGEVTTAQDEERAIGLWPTSKGMVPLTKPRTVGPSTPFDGGMKTYKRSNVAFKSGAKMTRANAVFVVQAGGTLSNVIIAGGGGVFCETHNCALVNVWFKDSVQGALHVNSGTGITTITGGGARNVARRIIFGQASGTVVVSGGFYMENSGRLFESCGTCGPVKRGVIVDGVTSVNPTAELLRMNANYNDRGTISKATITTSMANYPVCTRFNGGATPRKVGNGAVAPVCSYTKAAVTIK